MEATETRPTDEQIKAMAAKAEVPEGADFSEVFQRLRIVAKLDDVEAERWAHFIAGV